MQLPSNVQKINLASLRIARLLDSAPSLPLSEAVGRLYPHQLFLPEEGKTSVNDTLATFQISSSGERPVRVEAVSPSSDDGDLASVGVRLGRRSVAQLEVPAGTYLKGQQEQESATDSPFVPVPYHESFLAELALSHAVGDFCVVRSNCKSVCRAPFERVLCPFDLRWVLEAAERVHWFRGWPTCWATRQSPSCCIRSVTKTGVKFMPVTAAIHFSSRT